MQIVSNVGLSSACAAPDRLRRISSRKKKKKKEKKQKKRLNFDCNGTLFGTFCQKLARHVCVSFSSSLACSNKAIRNDVRGRTRAHRRRGWMGPV